MFILLLALLPLFLVPMRLLRRIPCLIRVLQDSLVLLRWEAWLLRPMAWAGQGLLLRLAVSRASMRLVRLILWLIRVLWTLSVFLRRRVSLPP